MTFLNAEKISQAEKTLESSTASCCLWQITLCYTILYWCCALGNIFLLRNTWVCPNTVDLYTPNRCISLNVENEVLNHEKNQGLIKSLAYQIIGLRMFQGHVHLVGGFKHFLFSIIYGIILPID